MSGGFHRAVGVVVVGVGIAGRIRIRDLCNKELNPNGSWKLVGFCSRRELAIEGAQQLKLEEALSRPDVDAVLVCTQPGAHEEVVSSALNNGKHVLVEYPVVPSYSKTKHLFQVAKEKGVVLHEENIALLSPSFAAVKEKLKSSPRLKRMEILLRGNYNGWVEDFVSSGMPFFGSISLIETVYELLGEDITVKGGNLTSTDEGFTAVAEMSTECGISVKITTERFKAKTSRLKTYKLEFEDGSTWEEVPEAPTMPRPGVQNSTPVKKPGMFMQDFLNFLEKVQNKCDQTQDIQRCLKCMEIAENIHKYMTV